MVRYPGPAYVGTIARISRRTRGRNNGGFLFCSRRPMPRSFRTVNAALAHYRDADRSPHGPPRPEQRRQSPHGACQRKCGNAGSHRERVASERRYEPERPCSRPQRARGAHTSGQPLLACGTSLAAVERAGGVRRALAPSHFTGGRDPVTAIRLSAEMRAAIDAWAAQQADQPPRSEAVRRMIEQVLGASKKKR
jgi:hypothetical protein